MSDSLDSLRAFVARNGGSPVPRHSAVAVFGAGKGGVGTSTTAALTAVETAARGYRVLLVDGDESIGCQHLLFGMETGRPGIGALKGGGTSPDQLLVSVAPNLTLLPGGGADVEGTLSLAPALRRSLFRRVAELYEDFDVVLVDGGSRVDSVFAALGAGVETVVAVTAPDRIALAGSYALLKLARQRASGLPVRVVLNRIGREQAEPVFRILAAAARTWLDAPVELLGAIPESPALSGGLPPTLGIPELEVASPVRVAARELADALVHRLTIPVADASPPPLVSGL